MEGHLNPLISEYITLSQRISMLKVLQQAEQAFINSSKDLETNQDRVYGDDNLDMRYAEISGTLKDLRLLRAEHQTLRRTCIEAGFDLSELDADLDARPISHSNYRHVGT